MVSEKILNNLIHLLPDTHDQRQRVSRAIDESDNWKFMDISWSVGVPAVIVHNNKTGKARAAYVVSRTGCTCPDWTDRVHPASDDHLQMCKHQIGAAIQGRLKKVAEVPVQFPRPVPGDADAPPVKQAAQPETDPHAALTAADTAAAQAKREAAKQDREALWPRDQYDR